LGRAEFKVPGGKLMAAETEAVDGRLVRVKITGDFFMHPEEAIEDLEAAVTGVPTDTGLEEAVERFFGSRSIDLIGASPADFIRVIRMSLSAP